ncbi:MAG TPA: hypothetical protein VF179_19375 [Thermoanaerobaculia bacterium]|nr:hypothetical protein [Thermoanaerobaculia bacterium]
MSGFLTDFWRDVISVSGFLLTLLQVMLPVATQLLTRAGGAKSASSQKAAAIKRRSHQPSEDDVLWGKVIAVCTPIVFAGSALFPIIDKPDVSGIWLLTGGLVGIAAFVAAFIQVFLAAFLSCEILVREYPKIEDFMDSTPGRGMVAFISWGLLLMSLSAISAAERSAPAWAFYMVYVYSLAVGTLSMMGLVAGVIGTAERCREIFRAS